ncbi:MAG: RNA polymerase beta subunit [Candidatus Parvarchaeum acidophilus ARMAN-5_'5-way FS']|jgi:DNA-directed RNA polymerase beta subunit|uniref:DNA-directed RNA polymerase n=1 Tax=Candidatus Parvarchaeum acidophilus ARMAN-5_'5-way FS' TaxID=994838 RepID=F2UU08_PARA5|nr:MAG: RNA polymerase beta subunit [Candidatus Parvarchaeum acidophilus ARMAN-5_'5-way FS']
MSFVFVNGVLSGTNDNPEKLVKEIIEDRRAGKIPKQVNIRYRKDRDSVMINSDGGRLLRALIVVKNGKSLVTKDDVKLLAEGHITWQDLIDKGKIEYLDADEEELAYTAITEEELTPAHTHLEITPLSVFGTQASLLPFINHSNAHRNVTAVKSVQQGVGIYSTNYLIRHDNDSMIAIDQQTPIVTTKIYNNEDFGSHVFGQNIVVAVLSYLGYNMDDAIIINKSSVDRGLFRAMFFRPYKVEETKYVGGQSDLITNPDKDVAGYRSEAAYKYLDEDGIAAVNSHVNSGDVLIGRVSPPRFVSSIDKFRLGVQKQVESSIECRTGEGGIVENVFVTSTAEGNKYVSLKIRQDRKVEIGDKFGPRSGQKGVVGMLLNQEDMPFTYSGIIPDLIFSPYSIPTRMSMAYLLELIGGKVGALGGRYIDGTPFIGEKEEDLRNELLEYGFRENGVETMYNGITGEEMQVKIFVGDMTYIRLKHFVANKIQWRARGPIQLLNRQPTEGKSKSGGLRLGEMEKDCFVAYGSAMALKERFDSDKITIPVCSKCGMTAVYNVRKKTGYCPIDGEDTQIKLIEVSASFKILLDELKAVGIYPKMVLGSKV